MMGENFEAVENIVRIPEVICPKEDSFSFTSKLVFVKVWTTES